MVLIISLYVVCERLSVMHKQVCVQLTSNSKFLSKFSRKGLLGISDQKAPLPKKWKTSDLRWPKFTPKYPPPLPKWKTSDWDDQSLLLNTPPQWKTSDLRWPKFTLKYPHIGLKSRRSYVESNVYPPWIPLVHYFPTNIFVLSFSGYANNFLTNLFSSIDYSLSCFEVCCSKIRTTCKIRETTSGAALFS